MVSATRRICHIFLYICIGSYPRTAIGLNFLSAFFFFLILLQFFAIKPLPCDPSSLPKYPPSKEFDAKVRDEEARRCKLTIINAYMFVSNLVSIYAAYRRKKKEERIIIFYLNEKKYTCASIPCYRSLVITLIASFLS